ncbi:MAG TPA: thiol peroxidase [Chloroflexaceae bacterium]|nr:thiol peroxidase [Chloroflexaceae bacterium]
MRERADAFDFFGPRALVGPELRPGDAAPDFALLTNRFKTVSLADFAGKALLISVVPSLDTGMCSKQTLRFNQAAAELADRASFIAVSADLPFAQARWCGSNDVGHVQALSDHRELAFGQNYGTYVPDFRIESRAVFVVDREGVIRHAEYVPSAGQEPDYDAALAALREAL